MNKELSTRILTSALIIGISIVIAGLLASMAIRDGLSHQTDATSSMVKESISQVSSAMKENICGEIFAADKADNKETFELKDDGCYVKYSSLVPEEKPVILKRF